jgi:hypothetical protein
MSWAGEDGQQLDNAHERNEGILPGFQTVGISRKLEVHGLVMHAAGTGWCINGIARIYNVTPHFLKSYLYLVFIYNVKI